jgi:hypothetical protein
MMRSGCEKVWPLFLPASTNIRHFNMMSSVISRTRSSNMGRSLWVSHSFKSVLRTAQLRQHVGVEQQRRTLQQLHELHTGRLALDTPVLFDRDDDDLFAAMHRDPLRAFALYLPSFTMPAR